MKILIVDDVFIIRKHIENTLKSLNLEDIIEAEHGIEAISQAYIHQPEVVFLDLNMPIVNGSECLNFLRRTLPEALIITMSHVDNQSPLIESLKLGADQYLTKPISVQQISECLSEKMIE